MPKTAWLGYACYEKREGGVIIIAYPQARPCVEQCGFSLAVRVYVPGSTARVERGNVGDGKQRAGGDNG